MKLFALRIRSLSYFVATFLALLPAKTSFALELRANDLTPIARCLRGELAKEVSRESVLSPRDRFIKENLDTQLTTAEQNEDYIELAIKTPPGTNTLFIQRENALMKSMNDHWPKNFVTSINNRYGRIFAEKLNLMEKRHPGLEFDHRYSDYKSQADAVQYRFRGDRGIAQGFESEIGLIAEESEQELMDELTGKGIIRQGDLHGTFRAGVGDTADRASMACRKARELPGKNRLVSWHEEWVQSTFKNQLTETERLRSSIASQMKGILPLEGPAGKETPNEKVFDLIRKSPSAPVLLNALKITFRRNDIDLPEAQALIDYGRNLDLFSLSLRIARRETANLDPAEKGGLAIDFLGFGALNQSALAKALAGVDNLNAALVSSRHSETLVTAVIKERRETIRKIIGEIVRCSGDDCAAIPIDHPFTPSEKATLLSSLASNPLTRAIRMAFIPEGVSVNDRTSLSTHGETIEKALRAHLLGKISASRLDELTFAIDMETKTLFSGPVQALAASSGRRLSATERASIQNALESALADTNKKISLSLLNDKQNCNYWTSH